MKPARNPTSGISLIEVLSSLTLFALILTMLVGVSSFLLPLVTRSYQQGLEVSELLGRRELVQAIEYAVSGNATSGTHTEFDGTSSELSFLAVPSGNFFNAGGLVVGQLSGSLDGVVGLTLSGKGPDGLKDVARTIDLSPKGAKLSLRYFGTQPNSAFPEWSETWAVDGEYPMLVMISIETEGRTVPPLLALPGRLLAEQRLNAAELVPSTNLGAYP